MEGLIISIQTSGLPYKYIKIVLLLRISGANVFNREFHILQMFRSQNNCFDLFGPYRTEPNMGQVPITHPYTF